MRVRLERVEDLVFCFSIFIDFSWVFFSHVIFYTAMSHGFFVFVFFESHSNSCFLYIRVYIYIFVCECV